MSCCDDCPKCPDADLSGFDVIPPEDTDAESGVDAVDMEADKECEIESCNGIDDDCDGETDEEDADGCEIYYMDNDDDTYGVTGESRCLCSADGRFKAGIGGDCNDDDPLVNPDSKESWNGVDEDCNGIVDDGITILVVEGEGTAHHPSINVIPGEDAVHVGWVEGQHTFLWGKSFHLGRLAAGGAIEPLLTELQVNFLYHSDSDLTVGSDGVLHAIWHVSGADGEEMAYTSVSPEGTQGAVTRITDMAGLTNTDIPHVALGDDGAIHTVWASDQAGPKISNIYYRKFERDPEDGSIIPLIGDASGVPLTNAVTEHPERRFDMIPDQQGDLVIVFMEDDHLALLLLDSDSGTPLIGPVPVTPSGLDTPMLFQTPDGTLHLALIIGGVAHYAHLGLDGTLLIGPVPVSGPDASVPGILVSNDGIAMMFWVAFGEGGVQEVFRRRVDPDTGLPVDLPTPVSPDDGVSSRFLRGYFSLDTSDDGAMHVTWWDTAEGNTVQSVHYLRLAP